MPAVYTRHFGHHRGPAGGPITLLQVPSVGVYILRDLVLWMDTTVNAAVRVWYVSGSSNVFLDFVQQATSISRHTSMRQVLPPGTTLQAASDAGAWSVTATGYVLD